jgi:hypothetical protein
MTRRGQQRPQVVQATAVSQPGVLISGVQQPVIAVAAQPPAAGWWLERCKQDRHAQLLGYRPSLPSLLLGAVKVTGTAPRGGRAPSFIRTGVYRRTPARGADDEGYGRTVMDLLARARTGDALAPDGRSMLYVPA